MIYRAFGNKLIKIVNVFIFKFQPSLGWTSSCHNSAIINFQSLIFGNLYILISTYNIPKNEKIHEPH